ncbi:zinc ribbon domain-containing protein [Streptomyces sp. NPDC049813]|uniref:zinc ribbon domain-containing protein n=1 Tax=Streptomyces sp. NPDC049813 TaxID=3365597 RepID=UPI00378AC951
MAKAVRVSLGEMWITCQVCKNDSFRERGVKLNSTGAELFKMAWADETATGLICQRCGYVQLFANRQLKLHRVDD